MLYIAINGSFKKKLMAPKRVALYEEIWRRALGRPVLVWIHEPAARKIIPGDFLLGVVLSSQGCSVNMELGRRYPV